MRKSKTSKRSSRKYVVAKRIGVTAFAACVMFTPANVPIPMGNATPVITAKAAELGDPVEISLGDILELAKGKKRLRE